MEPRERLLDSMSFAGEVSLFSRIFKLFLAVVLAVSLCPVPSFADEESSESIIEPFESVEETLDSQSAQMCGDSLEWFVDEYGTLTIWGEGAMWDFSNDDPAPWADQAADITSLVIEEGATTIGSNAFNCLYALENIQLPESVDEVPEGAFDDTPYQAAIDEAEAVVAAEQQAEDESASSTIEAEESEVEGLGDAAAEAAAFSEDEAESTVEILEEESDGIEEGSGEDEGATAEDDVEAVAGKDGGAAKEESEEDSLISVEDAESQTGISAADEGYAYAAGEVLVTFYEGTSSEEIEEALEETESVAVDQVVEEDMATGSIDDGCFHSDTALEPVAVLPVEEDVTVVQSIAELLEDPAVADASPNYLYDLVDCPADEADGSDLDTQGVEVNDPDNSKNYAAWDSVGIFDAWKHAKTDASVAIAIVDTGCNVSHPDIAPNVIATYNSANPGSGVEDGASGHGTHVAGIAAAAADNGEGVAGISYNAGLVIVKASHDELDANGNTYDSFKTSDVISAYDWILLNQGSFSAPIKVVNLSLGARIDSRSWDTDKLCRAIDQAKNAGILTVCASGNSSSTAVVPYSVYPGDYDSCLSVMNLSNAADYTTLNASSNYNVSGSDPSVPNATKDICAPGTQILSTSVSGGYSSKTGTSMATPIVSGIAALCFSVNPSLTPDDVKSLLESTATDLGDAGWDRATGYGRVNAIAALYSLMPEIGDPEGGEGGDPEGGDSDGDEPGNGEAGEGGEGDDSEGGDPKPEEPAEPEDNRIPISTPKAATGLKYTGKAITGVPKGSNYVIANNVATNPGSYTAVLNPRPGYKWDDGTEGPKTIEWKIAPLGTIALPTKKTGLVFNGKSQMGVPDTTRFFVSDRSTDTWADKKSGGGCKINAGTYYSYCILQPGYVWSDGTIAPKKTTWSIAKADATGVVVKYPYTKSDGTTGYRSECTYVKGKATKPNYKVFTKAGKDITSGVTYTVTGGSTVGTGTLTLTFSSKNFKGSPLKITKKFTVLNNKSGWQTVSKKRYYVYKGAPKYGMSTISGKSYYFHAQSGYLRTGLFEYSGKRYITETDGSIAKSKWKTYGGYKYYLSKSGAALTGWRTIGKYRYCFTSAGKMYSGLNKISGKTYFFDTYGRLQKSKWQKAGGCWYYLSKTGAALTGWRTIGGKKYWFDSSGRMATGKRTIAGKTYKFSTDGVLIG